MHYRRLGDTDLEPSVLGFGCSMIASLATRYSRAEVEATLWEARDAGITFFDTADVYGQGDSERMLGKLFSRHRQSVIFCTKAGLTVGPLESLVKFAKPIINPVIRGWRSARIATTQARRRQERQCFDLAYLSRRIEGSLCRLNVDRIDLFLLHNPPIDVPERDAVLDLLNNLKQQGKLRQYGVSCRTVEDAQVWVEQPNVACLQIPIDANSIVSAASVLEHAQARGIGVIAREVFSHGVLANASVTDAMSPLIERPEIGVILAGMTCRPHLHENLRAIDSATRHGYAA